MFQALARGRRCVTARHYYMGVSVLFATTAATEMVNRTRPG